MYMLSRVSGPIGPVFCVVVIFFGHFYVLNLFLAVIWHTYQNHAKLGDTPLSTQRSTQRDADNARDDNCEEPTRPLLFGYARSSPDLPPPPRLHRSLRARSCTRAQPGRQRAEGGEEQAEEAKGGRGRRGSI